VNQLTGWLGLALIVLGIVLVGIGFARGRGPWARYQALRVEDQNVARYEAWRGGVRNRSETGASMAMEVLRRQVRNAAAIAGVGLALVVIGFMLR
jgi:hypothetical protein